MAPVTRQSIVQDIVLVSCLADFVFGGVVVVVLVLETMVKAVAAAAACNGCGFRLRSCPATTLPLPYPPRTHARLKAPHGAPSTHVPHLLNIRLEKS